MIKKHFKCKAALVSHRQWTHGMSDIEANIPHHKPGPKSKKTTDRALQKQKSREHREARFNAAGTGIGKHIVNSKN